MKKSFKKNVVYHVQDGKLIIEIDLGRDFGESTTGKSHIVASTDGGKTFSDLPEHENMRLNLTLYKY